MLCGPGWRRQCRGAASAAHLDDQRPIAVVHGCARSLAGARYTLLCSHASKPIFAPALSHHLHTCLLFALGNVSCKVACARHWNVRLHMVLASCDIETRASCWVVDNLARWQGPASAFAEPCEKQSIPAQLPAHSSSPLGQRHLQHIYSMRWNKAGEFLAITCGGGRLQFWCVLLCPWPVVRGAMQCSASLLHSSRMASGPTARASEPFGCRRLHRWDEVWQSMQCSRPYQQPHHWRGATGGAQHRPSSGQRPSKRSAR